MFLQLRIDQRLIHGQVTQGWAKVLELRWIIVLSKALRQNPVAQKIMGLGVPEGLQVGFLTPEELANRWPEWEGEDCNTLIIADDLMEVLALWQAHGSLPEVILGNIHGEGNCRTLAPTVYCTEDEIQVIKTLWQNRVTIRVCSGVGDVPQELSPVTWQS